MGKYSGIYLFSDLDGTMLDDGKGVPEGNTAALRRFIEGGGGFGIATGRSTHNLNMGLDLGLVNAPCLLYNGAALYHMGRREYLHCAHIPVPEARAMIERILGICPKVSIQVSTMEVLYQVNPAADRFEDPLVPLEGIQVVQAGVEDIPGEWIKVVAIGEGRDIDRLMEAIPPVAGEQFSITRSGEIYMELLPKGTSKGAAIIKLRQLMPEIRRILAIGDYYNDLEMLKAADVSAAPANAPEDIRAVTDYTVCGNNQGAVAEFLERAVFSAEGA